MNLGASIYPSHWEGCKLLLYCYVWMAFRALVSFAFFLLDRMDREGFLSFLI